MRLKSNMHLLKYYWSNNYLNTTRYLIFFLSFIFINFIFQVFFNVTMTDKITDAVERYINNYSSTFNNFPPDAQKQTSRYYDFDSRHIKLLNNLEIFGKKAKNISYADGQRMKQMLINAIDLADRKVEISDHLIHLVEDSVFKLNMNLKDIETAQACLIKPTKKCSKNPSKNPKRMLKWVPNFKEIDSDSNDLLNMDDSNEHLIMKTRTSNRKCRLKENEDRKFQTSETIFTDTKQNINNKTNNNNLRTLRSSKRKKIVDSSDSDSDVQPSYCICEDISYGNMVCCDNDLCPIEWFHFDCVLLSRKPKGKWYCPRCRGTNSKVMKPREIFFKELEEYNKSKEESW